MEHTTLWVKKSTQQRIQKYLKPQQTVDDFLNTLFDQVLNTTPFASLVQKLQQQLQQSGKHIDNWLVFTTTMTEDEFTAFAAKYPQDIVLSYDGEKHTISLLNQDPLSL